MTWGICAYDRCSWLCGAANRFDDAELFRIAHLVMRATRIAGAMLKLSRGEDGIAAGLDADHGHGHGGEPWREKKDCDAG